jgi:hypothetical protein
MVHGHCAFHPPGEQGANDPGGRIVQPHLQEEQSGGFLEVTVRRPSGEMPAVAEFAFFDEQGTLLNSMDKLAVGQSGTLVHRPSRE